ncbi:hypothetical protein KR093_006198, partial [Drosophila rubida]
MMSKRIKAFSTSNDALPFNTSIIATIRTVDNDPVYSKLYPYPNGVADFVNKEITQLLQGGIIRPSRSAYNSPAWVVDKKGVDAEGNKNKRLVIDFRKLNDRTIADRYPMPSIPMILANLGKAKFFTTLDLKSDNHVADALSRQNINALQNEPASDVATIHSEQSLTFTVETVDQPVSGFRNQIILEEAEANHALQKKVIMFGSKMRHMIHFHNKAELIETLKNAVNPEVVNAIYCDLPTLALVQHELITLFPATKLRHC